MGSAGLCPGPRPCRRGRRAAIGPTGRELRVLGREEGDVGVAPGSGQMEGHRPGGVAGGEGAEGTGASYAVGSEADGWGKRPCQKVGDRLRFQSLIPGEGVTYREKPVF